MTIERKVGMGIAGQPSGDAANVAEVFSTHLYTGTNSTQTIINGIDLDGEGGFVWTKSRSDSGDNNIFYENGSNIDLLKTSRTDTASNNMGSYGTAFNSNGFSMGSPFSPNTVDMVAWTFRNKKKFFDIVTYTGNGTSTPQISQTVAHNLGSVPAMMIVKNTTTGGNWVVYHKNIGNTHELVLNETGGKASSQPAWNNTTPTDTVFTVGPDSNNTNKSGQTFIALLFADNSSEDAEDQMIKCGSFTEASSGSTTTVNLGWEPQWVIAKSASDGDNWHIIDSMRGFTANASGNSRELTANGAGAEGGGTFMRPTSTGFIAYPWAGSGGGKIIWMAIRAPMMVEPEAASEVFAIDNRGGVPAFDSGFPVDFFIQYEGETGARLTGRARMRTHATEAEITSYWNIKQFNSNVGMGVNPSVTTWLYSWMWKRAKGFMDVVAYAGNGVTGRTVAHSLGVVPEMIWVKGRDDAARNWQVLHKDVTNAMKLNTSDEARFDQKISSPSSTTFTLHHSIAVNGTSRTYIALLFASLDGVSKVGSYTGNGSSQTINCGFSAGAKYVLIKRTDATGDWHVWDSVRGIVAGNEPYFRLNIGSGEITNNDSIDPANSGFIVNQVSATNINVSSGTYIFYAIA